MVDQEWNAADDEPGGHLEHLGSSILTAPLCFALGILVQTYSPVVQNWITFTIILAEIICGLFVAGMCVALGIVLVTQFPTVGIIANIIHQRLGFPLAITYMPMPTN